MLAVTLVFLTLMLTLVNLISCTKTNTKTVTVYDTVTVEAPPSTLSLLTGKQWELDSVYSNYTGPGTGTLIYARGAAGNAEDLDNYYATYTIDGQFWQDVNGSFTLSNWSFTNNDSATIKIVSTSSPTDYYKVIGLSSTKYIIYDTIYNVYDVNIPAP
jgi:hypothetical protein